MSATASPFVSILSSYNASVEKGSAVVSFESTPQDGCTSMIRIDLLAPPGLGNANRSVKSSRASPWGKPKLGPGKWCDMSQSSCEAVGKRGRKSDCVNPVNRRVLPPRRCQHPAKESLNADRRGNVQVR